MFEQINLENHQQYTGLAILSIQLMLYQVHSHGLSLIQVHDVYADDESSCLLKC